MNLNSAKKQIGIVLSCFISASDDSILLETMVEFASGLGMPKKASFLLRSRSWLREDRGLQTHALQAPDNPRREPQKLLSKLLDVTPGRG